MPNKYEPAPAMRPQDYLDYFKPGTSRPYDDPRDYTMASHPLPVPPQALPPAFMLPQTPVQNQGQRGSCAAFGVGRTLTRADMTANKRTAPQDISEEALYAEGRARINLACQDGGSDPRTNAAICCELGLPAEATAPYLSHDLCWRPNADIWKQQVAKGEKYVSLQTREDVMAALVAGLEPTVCLTLYKNFAPDAAGFIPLPVGGVWGGHCMTFVGYDHTNPARKLWAVQNQWGAGWGKGGMCWLPDAFWDLPETQGGIWRTTGTWAIYVPVAPVPPPPGDKFYIQVWRQGKTGWDVGTPVEEPVGAYVTVKRTRGGAEEIVVPFQPVF